MQLAQSVEIPDDLIEALQTSAKASGRLLTEQVMHYIALGQVLERALPRDVIKAALEGRLAPESAGTRAPIDAALLDLVAKLTQPRPDDDAFFAERRKLGLGSGLDESGNIVSQEESTLMQRRENDLIALPRSGKVPASICLTLLFP